MPTLGDLVTPFVSAVASGKVEVYNEFSLQHELGFFLRNALPELKLQFERNVGYFFPDKTNFTKREIDISGFSPVDKTLAFAIELKYPRNGQYPEQMFSFCKDIAFAEELVAAGFPRSAFVVFADDHLFYRGPTAGIYGYFRGGRPIHGRIQKPTAKKDDEVSIHGRYSVKWESISGSLKFAIVEVVAADSNFDGTVHRGRCAHLIPGASS
jgi:hypothetical protein